MVLAGRLHQQVQLGSGVRSSEGEATMAKQPGRAGGDTRTIAESRSRSMHRRRDVCPVPGMDFASRAFISVGRSCWR